MTAKPRRCQVAVRIRPPQGEGGDTLIHWNLEQNSIELEDSGQAYHFDKVFGPSSTQEEVFAGCCPSLLDQFFEGYNCCILAYGQTGSGKTYTLGNEPAVLDAKPSDARHMFGIVPRMVHAICHEKHLREQRGFQIALSISHIEIYNEEVRDLLDTANDHFWKPHARQSGMMATKSVRIIEDRLTGGICILGVKNVVVDSEQEILTHLLHGVLCRQTASNRLNANSSRSHSIFTIVMISHSSLDESVSSKFHFVDLAGSERLKRTHSSGERLKEGISINTGLLALSNVINALTSDGEKAPHVSYRDSKLTRILQDSLGGNSLTLIIACISSLAADYAETLNTIRYAARASNIQNVPIANRDARTLVIESYQQHLHTLSCQLVSLKKKILGFESEASALHQQVQSAEALAASVLAKVSALLGACAEPKPAFSPENDGDPGLDPRCDSENVCPSSGWREDVVGQLQALQRQLQTALNEGFKSAGSADLKPGEFSEKDDISGGDDTFGLEPEALEKAVKLMTELDSRGTRGESWMPKAAETPADSSKATKRAKLDDMGDLKTIRDAHKRCQQLARQVTQLKQDAEAGKQKYLGLQRTAQVLRSERVMLKKRLQVQHDQFTALLAKKDGVISQLKRQETMSNTALATAERSFQKTLDKLSREKDQLLNKLRFMQGPPSRSALRRQSLATSTLRRHRSGAMSSFSHQDFKRLVAIACRWTALEAKVENLQSQVAAMGDVLDHPDHHLFADSERVAHLAQLNPNLVISPDEPESSAAASSSSLVFSLQQQRNLCLRALNSTRQAQKNLFTDSVKDAQLVGYLQDWIQWKSASQTEMSSTHPIQCSHAIFDQLVSSLAQNQANAALLKQQERLITDLNVLQRQLSHRLNTLGEQHELQRVEWAEKVVGDFSELYQWCLEKLGAKEHLKRRQFLRLKYATTVKTATGRPRRDGAKLPWESADGSAGSCSEPADFPARRARRYAHLQKVVLFQARLLDTQKERLRLLQEKVEQLQRVQTQENSMSQDSDNEATISSPSPEPDNPIVERCVPVCSFPPRPAAGPAKTKRQHPRSTHRSGKRHQIQPPVMEPTQYYRSLPSSESIVSEPDLSQFHLHLVHQYSFPLRTTSETFHLGWSSDPPVACALGTDPACGCAALGSNGKCGLWDLDHPHSPVVETQLFPDARPYGLIEALSPPHSYVASQSDLFAIVDPRAKEPPVVHTCCASGSESIQVLKSYKTFLILVKPSGLMIYDIRHVEAPIFELALTTELSSILTPCHNQSWFEDTLFLGGKDTLLRSLNLQTTSISHFTPEGVDALCSLQHLAPTPVDGHLMSWAPSGQCWIHQLDFKTNVVRTVAQSQLSQSPLSSLDSNLSFVCSGHQDGILRVHAWKGQNTSQSIPVLSEGRPVSAVESLGMAQNQSPASIECVKCSPTSICAIVEGEMALLKPHCFQTCLTQATGTTLSLANV